MRNLKTHTQNIENNNYKRIRNIGIAFYAPAKPCCYSYNLIREKGHAK